MHIRSTLAVAALAVAIIPASASALSRGHQGAGSPVYEQRRVRRQRSS